MPIEKLYPFKESEKKGLIKWKNHSSCDPNSEKKPYTIMLPPPNVTGALHLGHTLSSTLQDILIRFKRMQGHDVLWMPGVDHAGIATQMMVEKTLEKEGITRKFLGREKFLEKVWEWKEKYGDIIVEQMKRLGFSADWDRLCFTMDEKRTYAVHYAFVQLYKKGCVYRDYRLVHWDPALQTALSDLEVFTKEQEGTFWTIRYFLTSPIGEKTYIDIATTRPETLLGDSAIAVHPKDPRYQALIGHSAIVPLTDREIPIVADELVEIEKGSGALKITPAHDYTDFEIGKRHNLEFIDIFDEKSCLNTSVPPQFQGLERTKAREAILLALKDKDYLIKEETIIHSIPYSDRSGAIIEPRLMHQWFIDMTEMAKKAIKAVKNNDIKIVPEEWTHHYFRWLENIQPWCVSRQLWWGHRIPIWYGPDGQYFCAMDEKTAQQEAQQVYGKHVELSQDEDVLDTWFSSGLWPFATLGWPKETHEYTRYYPTDVLVTGHDILFFWVARMLMLGLKMTNQVPFHTLYLHPLIRDQYGKKMSKTIGNVINPLEIIETYGADALRFSMSLSATPTSFIRFGIKNVEQARNFITKLWNVGRFYDFHAISNVQAFDPHALQWIFNQWISSEIQIFIQKMQEALTHYRFHEASFILYTFVRNTFCDWYLELAKDGLAHETEAIRQEIRKTMGWAWEIILKCVHPFIPFVTEELWEHLCTDKIAGCLGQNPWPTISSVSCNQLNTEKTAWIIKLIENIRSLRSEFSIPFTIPLSFTAYTTDLCEKKILENTQGLLCRFLKLDAIQITDKALNKELLLRAVQIPIEKAIIIIPIAHLIDLNQERTRLEKAMKKQEKEIKTLENKIDSPEFISNAPADIIQGIETRLEEASQTLSKLRTCHGYLKNIEENENLFNK